ncbi:hypothetical protein BN12_2610003 [Nostocoides japonicum T1-X7]|uniref:Uncharacterized protein n=1 Tax=Nostocoides japonicum T1-X7 TaxID=1194083 RepID=A0A077M1V2_9MICO|nr:hypothetical protein [Tetrasphaera japonica]CCH78184.1 hypothetical protein BN12_2610003 [Tetrasphaera japonica T1-X7]
MGLLRPTIGYSLWASHSSAWGSLVPLLATLVDPEQGTNLAGISVPFVVGGALISLVAGLMIHHRRHGRSPQ